MIEPTGQNILACYGRANVKVIELGSYWYGLAHSTALDLVGGLIQELSKASGVIAAYSARTNWSRNIEHARRALESGKAHGGEGSGAMRFAQVLAQRILDGEPYDQVLRGKKMLAFARLIETGGVNCDEIVIDRHAVSIAIGTKLTSHAIDFGDYHVIWSSTKAGIEMYERFGKAYRWAANQYNMRGCQMQAITWMQHRVEHGIVDFSSQGTNAAGYLRRGSLSILDSRQSNLFEEES